MRNNGAILFYNAKIYTLENENDVYDAMLIKGGKIIELYPQKPSNSSGVRSLDCEGKTIIPSFSDAHLHFVFSAFVIGMGLCISEIASDGILPRNLQGVKEKIGEYIRINKTDTVMCFNYMVASIEEEHLPTRFELESWFPGVSISIISMDGHSSAHTKEVLEYMGMFSEEHNGILSGEDHEFNTGKLFNYFQKKKLNFFGMIKSLNRFTKLLLSYGVTDVTCLESSDDQKSDLFFTIIKLTAFFSKITFRISPQLTEKNRVKKIVGKDKHPKVGGCGTWELDGAIGSKTAAFDIPYIGEDEKCAKVYYTLEETQNMIQKFYIDGYQTMIHAIGTSAVDVAIKAYQNILGKNSRNEQRCRIEHFEFPTLDHVDEIAKMNLLVSVQPGYSWMDYNYQHSYEKWINPKLFERQVPLKTISEKGIYLLGSSDSPVQLPNPFIQLQGMVNYPIKSERLSIFQALRTFTYNDAYANFAENEKGTLKVGKQADFIILDRNPFEIEPSGLIDIKVEQTYIRGRRVW